MLLYLDCCCMMFDSVGGGIPSVLAIGVPDLHNIVIPPAGQKSPVGGPLQSAHVHHVCSDRSHVKLSHPGIVVMEKSLLVPAAKQTCLWAPG